MSTYFLAKMPKTDFVKAAVELGWKEAPDSNGKPALVSPNGHYCHDIEEQKHGDETLTGFSRYGGNSDVYELADDVGAISEHDAEFDNYCPYEED